MIYNKLDELIAAAMKNGNEIEKKVFRLIKAELTKAEKDGTVINDVTETKILLNMAKQREETIKEYEAAKRNDLAAQEYDELVIIRQYIPKQPTDKDIADYAEEVISTLKDPVTMKDMKTVLSAVQAKYPTANGKVVSEVLKSHIC